MSVLLDSNILLRFSQIGSLQHPAARKAIIRLRLASEDIYIVPQNIVEFWSVATRPMESNGLGLSILETKIEIRKFKRLFDLRDDPPNIFRVWESLVDKHTVRGRNVHDARLVAAMLEYRITRILTFNGKDFKRFSEIEVIDPRDVK